jgi:hypothetical protein
MATALTQIPMLLFVSCYLPQEKQFEVLLEMLLKVGNHSVSPPCAEELLEPATIHTAILEDFVNLHNSFHHHHCARAEMPRHQV